MKNKGFSEIIIIFILLLIAIIAVIAYSFTKSSTLKAPEKGQQQEEMMPVTDSTQPEVMNDELDKTKVDSPDTEINSLNSDLNSL
jgi:flagellar basal body-associated protein FliL